MIKSKSSEDGDMESPVPSSQQPQQHPRDPVASGAREGKRPLLSMDFSPSFSVLQSCYNASTDSPAIPRIDSFDFCFLRTGSPATTSSTTSNSSSVLCFGSSRADEMFVILSPTQGPQTTLLATLAGKQHALNELKFGQFKANDTQDMFSLLHAGVVWSSPRHMKTSTVEEEFRLVFNLRYPNRDKSVREPVIKDLLSSLNLASRAAVQIGRLAPWELKRVALGVELLSLPNMLFVDQPLADNRKADWEMIHILQSLQQLGVCQVVVTLHDPGSEIFHLIANHFTLLDNVGATVFVGNADDALRYADLHGYPLLDAHISTPDHLLLCAEFATQTKPSNVASAGASPDSVAALTGATAAALHFTPPVVPHTHAQRNQIAQFLILLKREMRFYMRDKRVVFVRLAMTSLIMAVCGVVFLHVAWQTPTYFVGSHYGSFAFTWFSLSMATTVQSVLVLSDVKPIIIRERASHTYAIVPVLFSKLLPEFIMNFALACEAVLILYFAVGWNGSYMLIVCGLWLLLESCVSYAYFFVFTFPSLITALVLAVVSMVPQLLFMGTFIRLNQVQPWLAWLTYVCNVAYGVKIVSAVEFDFGACTSPAVCVQWTVLLDANSVVADNIWWYCMVLGFFFLLYRLVAFVTLHMQIKRLR